MNPLISVIVPVYKVEKYLNRCVESIVEQTYTNLEIILVDDGSPDNCGKMCDEWAEKDTRIKAYHKENGGLSDARNFGTSKSTADYIAFIDSDDYILPEYFEILYNNMVKYNADISCCKMKWIYGEERELSFPENENAPEPIKMTGRDACFKMYETKFLELVVAPCKIYKKAMVAKHPYPLNKFHEDEFTTYKMLYESKTVTFTEESLYAYFQNSNSIMHSDNPQRIIDLTTAFSERATYYNTVNDRELTVLTCKLFVNISIYNHLDNSKRFSTVCYQFFIRHSFNGDIPKKSVFKLILYAISPYIYKKILNVAIEV